MLRAVQLSPSAGTGAVETLPDTYLRQASQELGTALAAPTLYGTVSRPIGHGDEEFVCADQSSIADACAMGIAGVATRYEVVGDVVRSVPIEMVGDQRAGSEACTRQPCDRFAAPMTSVGPVPELFVEDEARDGDEPGRRREGMAGRSSHPLTLDRFSRAVTVGMAVIARLGTEARRAIRATPDLKVLAALVAVSHFHPLIIPSVRR
jgi:hypothetical protein